MCFVLKLHCLQDLYIYTLYFDFCVYSMEKNKCGRRLKHINLSGCVNITDVTLQRISLALGSLTESKNTPQNKDLDNTASLPITEARRCCQQGMCRSQQERRISGLDFDSVDQTLRNACDVVEQEMKMACRLMEILEGERVFSPFLELSFLPSLMRDQPRTVDFKKWTKKTSGPCDQNKTSKSVDSRTLNSSTRGNQDLFPFHCVTSNRYNSSGSTHLRTNLSSERSPRQRTVPSLERVSGGDPHRTSSFGGRGLVVHEVCDNSDNDTPQRALTFLSLSGCSLVTDEGLRYWRDIIFNSLSHVHFTGNH